MARSASGFMFDISFMTDEDKQKVANYVAEVDTYWCKPEWIYDANAEYEWDRNRLFTEESGIWKYDIETMMDRYIEFVLKNYPGAECSGDAHYNQLNAEGTYRWSFDIKDGVATVTYHSEPLDHPSWCPECEEDLEYYMDDITVDNYMDYEYVCPNCGHVIRPYEDYDIEVERWEYSEQSECFDYEQSES